VVHVEGDGRSPSGAAVPAEEQCLQHLGAAVGEGRGDARQMHDPGSPERGTPGQIRSHPGRGRAAAVVVRAGAVRARVLEVDPGRTLGIGLDAAHVHTARGEFGQDTPGERIVAQAAHPGGAVPEPGQPAGDVGLGTADAQAERGLFSERAGVRRAEHSHRLPDTHDLGHLLLAVGGAGRKRQGRGTSGDQGICGACGSRGAHRRYGAHGMHGLHGMHGILLADGAWAAGRVGRGLEAAHTAGWREVRRAGWASDGRAGQGAGRCDVWRVGWAR
jgi:hypothetical protein